MKELINALTNAIIVKDAHDGFIDVFNKIVEIEAEDSQVTKLAIAALGHRITFDDDGIAFIEHAGSRVTLRELLVYIRILRQLFPFIPDEDYEGENLPGIELPGSGGAIIDDSVTVLDKTWSSSKIQTGLNTKQNTGNYISEGDSRLSDARSPLPHTHSSNQVTGLGNAATKNTGTTTGTVCAGDDSRLSNARTPTGSADGDVTGTYPSNITLKPTGVTAGSNFLASVTIDTKGRVTAINAYDPAKEGIFTDHFTTNTLQLFAASGSKNGIYQPSVAAHPGILQFQCDNAGTYTVQKSATQAIIFGGGIYRFRSIIRIPTVATSGDGFNCYWGFLDSSGASPPQNGCLFIHDNSRGIWARNVSAGSVTEASSGISIVAGAWYDTVVEINKAANSITYYVNGNLVQTLNTNIPTTTLAYGYHIYRAASVTTGTLRAIDVDFFSFYWNFN